MIRLYKVLDNLVYVYNNMCHLGDIIGLVQRYHQMSFSTGKRYVFCVDDTKCFCHNCDNTTANMYPKIINLLDTRVGYCITKPAKVDHGCTHWHCGHQMPYVKAKNLPKDKKDHITTQLLLRSNCDVPRRHLHQDEIRKILSVFPGRRIYNISDDHVEGTNYFIGSVRDKLDLIATAQLHVSTDSGTAHLAGMTYTPTVIIAPEPYRNRYYNNNSHFFVNTDLALPFMRETMKSLRAVRTFL